MYTSTSLKRVVDELATSYLVLVTYIGVRLYLQNCKSESWLIVNCYFFTNIEPAPIIVKHPAVHQNKPTPQQAASRDTISQQTHPQQPDETRIYPSMLTNRQVPVLNLTETNITSHTDLQDAFNSLCVCSHGGREDTKDQSTE